MLLLRGLLGRVLSIRSLTLRGSCCYQGAFVCLPCALADFQERDACKPVLDYLSKVSKAPGWRLTNNDRGLAERQLRQEVCQVLNTRCLNNAQPHAAELMARYACDLFVSDDTVVLKALLGAGPPSCGKNTMFHALCTVFGAKEDAGKLFFDTTKLAGACSLFLTECTSPLASLVTVPGTLRARPPQGAR